MPDNAELIRTSPITQELTPEECARFAEVTRHRTLGDDQVLIREGTKDNCLHIVVKGRLAVERDSGVGDPTLLTMLRAGDLAGELGFIDGTEHSATLRAIGETEVVSINRGDFESLVPTQPMIVYKVMRGILRSVHQILRRMNTQYVEMSNYINKAHGRY